MAAFGFRVEFEAHSAFLSNAYQSYGNRDRHNAIRNRQTLIEHALLFDMPCCQKSRNFCCAFITAQLFVMPKGQIDRALWLETLSYQQLNCLKNRHCSGLVIHRTSAPNVPIRQAPLKRRLLPASCSTRLDGDDVLVSREKNRCRLVIFALPGVEQAVVADDLLRQR